MKHILKPDLSRGARRDRQAEGIPDPEFVVEGDLVTDGARVQDVKVEVTVEFAGTRMVEKGLARRDEPVFTFRLNQSSQEVPEFHGAYPTLSYWLTISELFNLRQPRPAGDDFPLELDNATMTAIMVWWDAHGEEAINRIPDKPSREDVARALTRAGLPVRPCGLNADWSVAAWYLGPPPGKDDLGRNRTEGGFYLLDTEDDDQDGIDQYALVRRYYEDGENDRIEEVADGSLGAMIELIPSFS